MMDHCGISVADVAASARFYDAVLAPLGHTRQADSGHAIGYGSDGEAGFWIVGPASGASNRESHLAFAARDEAAVDAFFVAAQEMGADVVDVPQVWPEYHAHYYGAFVRDPDGNNVEAVCHTAGA